MPKRVTQAVTHTEITAESRRRISRLERRPSGAGQPFLSSSFSVQSAKLDPPRMGVPFVLDLSRDSNTQGGQVCPPRLFAASRDVAYEFRFSDDFGFGDNSYLHGATLDVYAELGAFSLDGSEVLVVGMTAPVTVDFTAFSFSDTLGYASWNYASPVIQIGSDLYWDSALPSPQTRIKTTAGGMYVATGFIEFDVTV